MRLPVRQIQAYLATVHELTISVGELVELLHRLKKELEPPLSTFKAAIRASPAVQADETGWRADGSNGYIWSVSTPVVRYYQYHHSRGHEVVEALLGEDFQGGSAVTSTRPTIAIRGCISAAGCIPCGMGMS